MQYTWSVHPHDSESFTFNDNTRFKSFQIFPFIITLKTTKVIKLLKNQINLPTGFLFNFTKTQKEFSSTRV